VAHSGEFCWVLGRWKAEKLDTKQFKYGHFVTVWRKQADGSWKVIGDTAVVSAQEDPAAKEPIALQTPAFTGGKGKTDVAAVRSALLEQDRKLTASAGKSDATEYLSFLAPDALVLRTRKDPQQGQPAFDTLKASWTPLPWHQGGGEMSNAGDMAFTYGVREDPDTPDRTESGYMRIWERQKDGSWKVVVDLVNGLPPHTGLPPATPPPTPTPEAPKQPG
jgi:ketosteroid isomerase-like protein